MSSYLMSISKNDSIDKILSVLNSVYNNEDDANRALKTICNPNCQHEVDFDEFTESFGHTKAFKKAVRLFKSFHGKKPDSVIKVEIPQIPESDDIDKKFFVLLGEAPSESYLSDNIVPGSEKDGAVYVHPYETPDGELPMKIVSADGKLILTVPGNHRVKDWIYG